MAENPTAAGVLERCDIRPSANTTSELTLPLLHFDITWLYFHPVQRLLFFDFPCSKAEFLETVVPKLKESLHQTLNHFLPLAGNIVHPLNSDRPFSRFVDGDSVLLTIAESDKDFDYLTGNHPRVADEFYVCVPQLPPAKHTPDVVILPVLALQITLFPDRGVCLGITNHHAIGDASSIVRFIKAWASVNRSSGDSKLVDEKLLPFYDRTSVEDPEGLDSIYWNLIKQSRAVESLPISFPLNKVRATFILTKDDVQKLKHFVLERRPEMRITAFTVTCALVWVCLVKVDAATETLAEDEPEYFGFAADCRGRLSPPLPAEYFGNCLAFVKAESTHGLLKGNDGLLFAAQSVGEAIQKTVYNEKGILDGAENWPIEFGKLIGKRLFGVAGSPRFDLYDVDYGWGRPNKFESASIDGDTSMSLCKSRDFEGGLEIGLSRPKEKLDAFAAIFTKALGNL
ncbi:UNVERIFIED_CONTAM: Phenolic glucoside malonyltransferase 1 [Sesamum calycinum]|uniref:Phenolic glucoside malonyltransferase 1 n=1 Tax=Sesamum calycinum TaxID=2727403 RepID=A0AAW2IW48_9LAMI